MTFQPGDFIDSHVHLMHEDFSGDLEAILDRARASRVRGFIVPATDAASSEACLDLSVSQSDVVTGIGIHPHDVSKASEGDLKHISELSTDRRVVAIGEIGLDYYYDFSPKDVQKRYFRDQLYLAAERDLPVIVHTRESMLDAIEIVRKHVTEYPRWCHDGGEGRRGVFHCFTGTEEQARELFSLGFYISFPGILTFKRSPVTDVFKAIGMERVLLETDAPYMAPVPVRGKRNEPSYMVHTAQRMAELSGMSVEEVANVTRAHTIILFRPE